MVSIDILPTCLGSDYTDAAAVSGVAGAAGFFVLITILLFIYSIISFLLPVFIYRIMRRNTASYERLGEIRDLLRKQEFLYDQAHPQPQITANQPLTNTIVAPPPVQERVNIFSGEVVR
jgi:hypothetical protein